MCPRQRRLPPDSMIGLQIAEPYQALNYSTMLTAAAKAALLHEGISPKFHLTIVLTGDAQLQQYNKDFRGKDAPTDVLSFPSGDTQDAYLGDILISHERAVSQSQEAGHSIEQELQLLVVHAVLHLLGYDHATKQEKSRMWAAQSEILKDLGNPLTP
ncbi:MAG: rRNA maturation RNase YbeY [Anaerolineae bacterium]|nr:rRNA maturation RNase YbeY [Anaerolineae bacterium]